MQNRRDALAADCIFKVSLRQWRADYQARKDAGEVVEKPVECRRVLRPSQQKRVIHLRDTGDFATGRAPQAR